MSSGIAICGMQVGSNGEKAGETEGETPEDGQGSQHEVCMGAAMIVHKTLRSFAGREALRNVNNGKCIDQKVWCRTSPQTTTKGAEAEVPAVPEARIEMVSQGCSFLIWGREAPCGCSCPSSREAPQREKQPG